MTQSQYRALVVATLVLGISAAALDFIVPTLLPEPFHTAQTAIDETVKWSSLSIGLLFGIPGAGLWLAGTCGLFFFRRWAPRIALAGTLLSLVGGALFGATAQSGVSLALGAASSYLWGAALLLPFLPQYASWFQTQQLSTSAASQETPPK